MRSTKSTISFGCHVVTAGITKKEFSRALTRALVTGGAVLADNVATRAGILVVALENAAAFRRDTVVALLEVKVCDGGPA